LEVAKRHIFSLAAASILQRCVGRPIPAHKKVQVLDMLKEIAMTGMVALTLVGQGGAGEAASERIDLYVYTGKYPLSSPPPDLRPIQFNIPAAYRFGSTKNATKTWAIELLTFYPSFGPASDEAHGEEGVKCAGICNGRKGAQKNLPLPPKWERKDRGNPRMDCEFA
jgi:hypothetical protein